MNALVIGGSGMLGQALGAELEKRGIPFSVAARSGCPNRLDLSDKDALERFDFSPYSLVINAAANINLADCEKNPEAARQVNALAVGVLAAKAAQANARFVQVSTDHYYSGDGRLVHDEKYPIKLLNVYASSKYEGEKLALENQDALVVRTNIVGWRGWAGQTTFVEWLWEQLRSGQSFKAFTDYFTSSLDTASFSRALLDLLSMKDPPRGLLNLASSQVASKAEFIEAFAQKSGYGLQAMVLDSVKNMAGGAQRAESLGLDVRNAERLLGYSLPDLNAVTGQLWQELQQRNHAVRS